MPNLNADPQTRRSMALRLGSVACVAALCALGACDDGKSGGNSDADAVGADVSDSATTPEVVAADTANDLAAQADEISTPDSAPEVTPDAAPDLTVTPDTTTSPDVTVPTGLLCPSLASCMFDACAQATAVDLPTCAAAAAVTCQPADAAESAGALSLVQCASAAGCSFNREQASHYTCLRLSCLTEDATCWAPSATGNGACGLIGGCLSSCFDQPGAIDVPCHRACLEAVSPATVAEFLDLDLCTEAGCVDSAPENHDQCKATTATNGLTCTTQYDQCFGGL
ncbi:MAG: hypothetical protein R3F39_21690 [Myxococcota bacterium]